MSKIIDQREAEALINANKQAEIRAFDTRAPMVGNPPVDPRPAQLLILFDALDERGKATTLAMLAVAVKLHPKA